MAGFRVVFAVAVVSWCALFYACVVAHLQVPIHYANFQLEVEGLLDKHPVAHLLDPKRRRAEESEGSQSQGSKRSKK